MLNQAIEKVNTEYDLVKSLLITPSHNKFTQNNVSQIIGVNKGRKKYIPKTLFFRIDLNHLSQFFYIRNNNLFI